MVSKFLTAIAASALVAAPIAANAKTGASTLSAGTARASAPSAKSEKLAGTNILFALLAAAIVAGGLVLASQDDAADSG